MSTWSFEKVSEVCHEERLPAVVADLDAFDRNVRSVARIVRSSGKTLRIATKSLRVPDLLRRILNSDPVFKGLMCFSAAEARFLAEQGFDDLLLAYPTLQKADLADLRAVHESGKLVRLVVDSEEGAAAVAKVMSGVRAPFRVMIDVDASIRLLGQHVGVQRSPIRTTTQLGRLADAIHLHKELRFDGLMMYEAQVAGLGDRNPYKRLMNPVFKLVRWLSVRAVAARRREFALYCRDRGWNLEVFNGAGSGSLSFAGAEGDLTELTAGSAFLCSHLFDYYSNLHSEAAFYFLLPTVRAPESGIVTCLGGGYIASGEPGWDKIPRPVFPTGAKLLSMEGAGEVQTPVRLPANAAFQLGQPVFFRHAKAGELAERFQEYLLISDGKLVNRAKSYRGLGRCFF